MFEWVRQSKQYFGWTVLAVMKPKIFVKLILEKSTLKSFIIYIFWLVLMAVFATYVTDKVTGNAANTEEILSHYCNEGTIELQRLGYDEPYSNSEKEGFVKFGGMKAFGQPIFSEFSDNGEANLENDNRYVSFTLGGVIFPAYCWLDKETPQLAIVPFGFTSIMFTNVVPLNLYSSSVTLSIIAVYGLVFAITIYYILLKLATPVNFVDLFKGTIFLVSISYLASSIGLIIFGLSYGSIGGLGLDEYFHERLLFVFKFFIVFSIVFTIYCVYFIAKVTDTGYVRSFIALSLSMFLSFFLVPLILIPMLFLVFNLSEFISILWG